MILIAFICLSFVYTIIYFFKLHYQRRNQNEKEILYIERQKEIDEIKNSLPLYMQIQHYNISNNLYTDKFTKQDNELKFYKSCLKKIQENANNEKNRIFTEDEINGYIDYYELAQRIFKSEGKYEIYFTEKQKENLNNKILKETLNSIKYPEINYNNSIYKNNKIYSFKKNYIVFDLETTGLNCIKDKIIEIAAIKYKNYKMVDSFHYLINPRTEISNKITELTGITTNDVKNADTIENVLPKFIDFIEDYPLVAHNSSFDLGFIERNLKLSNIKLINNKNIDTLFLARKYIKCLKNYKLETLKKMLNLNFKSHSAYDDCLTTNEVYLFCKKQKEDMKLNMDNLSQK